MKKSFTIGDHVSWNSEAGQVSGTIIKIHHSDFEFKDYTHHASKHDPQYEIKSDKTEHIAAHKGGALQKLEKEKLIGLNAKASHENRNISYFNFKVFNVYTAFALMYFSDIGIDKAEKLFFMEIIFGGDE